MLKMSSNPQKHRRNKIKAETDKKQKLNGNNSLHISIITLNANGLNAPIKRLSLEKWIKKS